MAEILKIRVRKSSDCESVSFLVAAFCLDRIEAKLLVKRGINADVIV